MPSGNGAVARRRGSAWTITKNAPTAFFVILAVGLAVGSWVELNYVRNWWYFALTLVALMVGIAVLADESKFGQVGPVAAIGILNAVAALIVGCVMLHTYNVANHLVPRTLVCAAIYSEDASDWQIVTSTGTYTPEAGFYDGSYYQGNSEALARLLVGHWARLTWHGQEDLNDPPYTSSAKTLGPGRCAN